MLSNTQAVVATFATGGVIFVLRALPFLLFSKREPPRAVRYVAKYIPPFVLAVLLVYCLRGIDIQRFPFGLPEAAALAVAVALHLWKRNAMISVFAATALYMLLIPLNVHAQSYVQRGAGSAAQTKSDENVLVGPPNQSDAAAPAIVAISPDEPAASQSERAELIMKALSIAYPDRVGDTVFLNGDWAVPVNGVMYYYAEGRLLPENLRLRYADYDPQPFYRYRASIGEWEAPTAAESERFRNVSDARTAHPPKRSAHFFDALWRASTREEAYSRLKTINFLGHRIDVHYAIMEELALVEERIMGEAKKNPAVKKWLDLNTSLTTWNWRAIADTESRSFHAYGSALDFLPSKSALKGWETYWLWTSQQTTPEWWTVPFSKRLHPPEEVVKAFETFGFVWGGKWVFYDTMHFEFRPEILLLNGIRVAGLKHNSGYRF
ncbi:MAG: hypothetical protein Ta2A_09330 [Treponemataceae bacterium]|nr:MAG: hypothetical protein Ta2A_09330 [Treponemataceae bacterium]